MSGETERWKRGVKNSGKHVWDGGAVARVGVSDWCEHTGRWRSHTANHASGWGRKMEDLVGTKQKMRQRADRGMEGGSDTSSSSDQMFL